MVFSLAGCGGSSTKTKEGTEGLIYEQFNGSYMVTGYEGSEVNIVIPDTYNDVPVTRVDDEAFFGSDIQSVDFGTNMEYIGYYALGEMSLLKSVTFNSPVINLEAQAFLGCRSLETVNFNNGSTMGNIGKLAFDGCSSLSSIKLSENTVSIGEQAFMVCTGIKEITIPASVTSVGAEAFRFMTSEQKIIIEGSTDGWMDSAFVQWYSGCDAQIIYK